MSDFSVREPTCQELAEFLTDYLEGLLTLRPSARASIAISPAAATARSTSSRCA